MFKTALRDMVIMLPGIMGTVLEKDGREVWGVSGQVLFSALSSLGGSLQALTLGADDPTVDDLGDGVHPVRLISDVTIVPGLMKIDGYTGLWNAFIEGFDVTPGSVDSPEPANLFQFPYDWRRDNRANARRLQRFVEERLPAWREFSGADDAQVILLGHSMGGLVSRYYLEVLGGWQSCRALFTFGTPHRGAVNAVNFVCNGYKKAFIDLTGVLRTLTSVYQLLPIYQCVKVGAEYKRVAETSLPNMDQARAQAGLQFHREIEQAVARNQQDEAYRRGFRVLPLVGTRQTTLQSAVFDGGAVAASDALPVSAAATFAQGDGTVPMLSAIPIELSDADMNTFVVERHASLQNFPPLLQDVMTRIALMQTGSLSGLRAPQPWTRPGINLQIDDLYLPDEPVSLRATVQDATEDAGPLVAQVEPVGVDQPASTHVFHQAGDHYELELPALAPGSYRVQVAPQQPDPTRPLPVNDVFEVAVG